MNNWQLGLTWGLLFVQQIRASGLAKRLKNESKAIRQHVTKALAEHRIITAQKDKANV